MEDDIANYPQGLVLVPRGQDDNSMVVGPHIRGSRLRASAAGDEEVDLLLPGTARYDLLHYELKMCSTLLFAMQDNCSRAVESFLANSLRY